MYKAIFFDLDATLLPLNESKFIDLYFNAIDQFFQKHGFPKGKMIEAVWYGTKCMVQNKGEYTNEKVFWDSFLKLFPDSEIPFMEEFTDFYEQNFDVVKQSVIPSIYAKKTVDYLNQKGYQLILATNPLFPKIATHKRIQWAGLQLDNFHYITTYENANYAKPNLAYYQQILSYLNLNPQDCLMIGNDTDEDMVAKKLGFDVYLVTDCMNNKSNQDINQYPHGTLEDLYNMVTTRL